MWGTTGRRVSSAAVFMHFVFFVEELFVLATLGWILCTTHVKDWTAWIFKYTVDTTFGRVFGATSSVLLVVGSILFGVHTVLFTNITLGQVFIFLLFAAVSLLRIVVIIEHLGGAHFRGFVAIWFEGRGSGE